MLGPVDLDCGVLQLPYAQPLRAAHGTARAPGMLRILWVQRLAHN